MSGPVKPYEPDDPTELLGVGLAAEPDAAALRAMAVAFIEEYALMGWPRNAILRLFTNPRFAGPHRAYRALGADAIRELVAGVFPEAEAR